MPSSSPTRTGSALLAFLMGVFLTLSGFALGIVADRELYPVPTVSTPVIPTVGARTHRYGAGGPIDLHAPPGADACAKCHPASERPAN